MELKANCSTLSISAELDRFIAHVFLVTQKVANTSSCTNAHSASK